MKLSRQLPPAHLATLNVGNIFPTIPWRWPC